MLYTNITIPGIWFKLFWSRHDSDAAFSFRSAAHSCNKLCSGQWMVDFAKFKCLQNLSFIGRAMTFRSLISLLKCFRCSVSSLKLSYFCLYNHRTNILISLLVHRCHSLSSLITSMYPCNRQLHSLSRAVRPLDFRDRYAV